MGKRKREMAERLKEIKRQTAIAKVKDVPSSPRKMRLVADTVRGVEVNHAPLRRQEAAPRRSR